MFCWPGGPGWSGGSGGPGGSCESCGSGWDGGPGESGGSCWPRLGLGLVGLVDDPQVFDDPKGISIVCISMDFDNPKVYGDTFIFVGLVLMIVRGL